MKKEQTLTALKRLLPASLLAGLLCGGLLKFLSSYADTWCWHGIICLNHGIFDTVSTLHALVLSILALFLSGMLAVALQRGEVESQVQAAFAGGVSGCMVCLVIMVYARVSDLLSRGSTDLVEGLIYEVSFILRLAPSVLLWALIMAVLAVLGALLLFSSQEKTATPGENARASRLVIGSTAFIILALMVIPPLVAHLMLGAGMIGVHPSAAIGMTVISVERTAPDAIVLTARDIPSASALADPPFSVYLNGVVVSNASAAAASGLDVSVDPAGGLQAAEGSRAAWKGTAVMNNGTPVSVAVAVHGIDGSKQFVLDILV
ncbi:hypothetical protein [Methanofollis ethanolicus]|uniref:hypothetical protein n=1 Tax=Methanofollis ethanolicus TaxID=488124 RepID=UPI0008341C75|nr:hypothetical protein [Methanofollis ethanolicus]